MPVERIDVKASDNEYLHKDFHGALRVGIEFIREKYGEDAVKEYLSDFAHSYLKSLTEEINLRGLNAIKDYYENIYKIEDGDVEFQITEDELLIKVKECPAVMHMKANNYSVSKSWIETIRTVNEAICDNTRYKAELLEYNVDTGASIQRFSVK